MEIFEGIPTSTPAAFSPSASTVFYWGAENYNVSDQMSSSEFYINPGPGANVDPPYISNSSPPSGQDQFLRYHIRSPVNITAITKASPGVVTANNHGLVDGGNGQFHFVTGMTELNNNSTYPQVFTKVLTANTFSLYLNEGLTTPLDTSAFGTFVNDGNAIFSQLAAESYLRFDQSVHYPSFAWYYPNLGDVFHLGFKFRVVPVGENRFRGVTGNTDVFHDASDTAYYTHRENLSKTMFLWNGTIRWCISFGTWSNQSVDNTDGKFTIILTKYNTYNLITEANLAQNVSPYSAANPIQLDYNVWYAAALEVKVGDNNDGYLKMYVDGTQVYERLNQNTLPNGYTPEIQSLSVCSTMNQADYDSPEHYRDFDKIIVTGSLSEMQSLGLR